MRISGPFAHKGLSVYFLHDESRGGAVPLTLQEALMRGDLRIDETGNIHELGLENLGDSAVFIQAGDLVKGGRQDRVLGVSMLVPAKSGRIPISAFCVESGRWSRRGYEDVSRFSSSERSYSSPRAKMALRRSAESYDSAKQRFASASYSHMQSDVWSEVAETQTGLAASVGGLAYAAASPTSLELSMDQQPVKEAQAEYREVLEKAGRADPTITGAIFAVGGALRNADAYPWSGLFQKMWEKNLNAGIAEAMRASVAAAGAPAPEAVQSFLRAAEDGAASEHPLPLGLKLRQRLSQGLAYLESLGRDGAWVHRSYVAQ